MNVAMTFVSLALIGENIWETIVNAFFFIIVNILFTIVNIFSISSSTSFFLRESGPESADVVRSLPHDLHDHPSSRQPSHLCKSRSDDYHDYRDDQ